MIMEVAKNRLRLYTLDCEEYQKTDIALPVGTLKAEMEYRDLLDANKQRLENGTCFSFSRLGIE